MGNAKTTTLSSNSSSYTKTIVSSANYTNNGNLLASATDGNGITTAYEYASAVNKVTGQPSAITDANGTVTSYTMDSLRRISNIQIANKAEIDYNYSNGMLSSISRRDANGGSQSYWLTYDASGNPLSYYNGTRYYLYLG